MINLNNNQKIIDCDRIEKKIFKQSLKNRAIINEWTLGIIKEYGSMNNYKAIKRAETKKFVRDVLK